MLPRPHWSEYFLGIAEAVSARGDCMRCKVGAVLIRPDHSIASTGYNGTWPGGPSCLAGDCARCSGDYPPGTGYEDCIEIHAEQNCLGWAREDTTGYTMAVTREPCFMCVKAAQAHRLRQVFWPEDDIVHVRTLSC